MSDDLVKRWDDYVESMGCVMGEVEHTAQQMRDRIEELEAKLAKALEALEFIDGKISWEINPSNYDHDQVCKMNADWCEIGNYAEATLAELKGQDDE